MPLSPVNSFTDGNILTGAQLNAEFANTNAYLNGKFNASSGHAHTGTTDDGPQIGASGLVTAVLNLIQHTSTDAAKPTAPVAGMLDFATDTKKQYVWDGSAWQPLSSGGKLALTSAPSANQEFGWGADNAPAWQDKQGAVWGDRDQLWNLAVSISWDADSGQFVKTAVGSGSNVIGGGIAQISSGATANSSERLNVANLAGGGVDFAKQIEATFWATFTSTPDSLTTSYFGVGWSTQSYARFKQVGPNITLEYYNGTTVTTSANINPQVTLTNRNRYRVEHLPGVGVYFFINNTLVNPIGFGTAAVPAGFNNVPFDAQVGNGATAVSQNITFGPVVIVNR